MMGALLLLFYYLNQYHNSIKHTNNKELINIIKNTNIQLINLIKSRNIQLINLIKSRNIQLINIIKNKNIQILSIICLPFSIPFLYFFSCF